MRIRHYLLLIIIITLLVYGSSFWNRFVWDDEQFIYKNAYVLTFDLKGILTESTTAGAGVVSNYYRPLTTLSFAFDHAIWGSRPFGFHLTNTALHLSAGVLLFLLLLKLRLSRKYAFIISLIFLIHPIQTEAVTYINSRGDSLYVVLGLLAVHCLLMLSSRKKTEQQIAGIEFTLPHWLLALITVLLYLGSILAKEIGVVFGGLMVLVWLTIRLQNADKRYRNARLFSLVVNQQRTVMTIVLAAVVAIGYLLLRATTLNFDNSFDFYEDNSLYSQSLLVRLLTFTRVWATYLRLLVIPYPLHMERSVDLVTTAWSWWPWLFLITNGLALLFAFRRLQLGKPLALLGWLWFYLALLPVSGILPINGIIYEHWLYLPMVGFFLFGLELVRALPQQLTRPLRQYQMVVVVSMLTAFAVLTIRQNYLWSTPIRLYTHLLNYTASLRIYNNLGMAYAEAGQIDQALAMYDQALAISDQSPQVYHNRGNVFKATGQWEQAAAAYEQALELSPSFFYSYPDLLVSYAQLQEWQKATALLDQGQQQFPNNQVWEKYRTELKRWQTSVTATPSGQPTPGTLPSSAAPASTTTAPSSR